MLLKKCAACRKDIPAGITVCPYCRVDGEGRDTREETAIAPAQTAQIQEDLALLASEDPILRKAAADRLGQRGGSVVPLLVDTLNAHTHKGLSEIAQLLGRLRDRRGLDALIQALKIGDQALRVSAIWALAQFNDPLALDELIRESQRTDPTVQSYVAHAFAGFQDARILPALIRLAGHESRDVAFQAIWSLGEAGNAQAVMPLRRMLGRKDPLIRSAAGAALKRLGGPVRRAYPWSVVAAGTALAIGLIWLCVFFWRG